MVCSLKDILFITLHDKKNRKDQSNMQQFIIEIMDKFGYLGISFLIALENIFPPIPSEIVLSFGGFMTTYTSLTVPLVILFSTIGAVIGAIVLYGVGLFLTPERLEQLLQMKLFRLLGFKAGDITKTVNWFEKHGKSAILFGRCIPIIRSLISIPAGMAKINFSFFLLYTVIGSTLWNILLVSLGAFLGASWEKVLTYFDTYSSITLVVLIIVFLLCAFFFLKKRLFSKKEDNILEEDI